MIVAELSRLADPALLAASHTVVDSSCYTRHCVGGPQCSTKRIGLVRRRTLQTVVAAETEFVDLGNLQMDSEWMEPVD